MGERPVKCSFDDPGHCGWAAGEDPKVWNLTCCKYAGKRNREGGRGEWVTANLRRGIQERAGKCADELALEEIRVIGNISKKQREETARRSEGNAL